MSLLVSVCIGLMRLLFVSFPQDTMTTNIFKDVAHLWVGSMFGAWLILRFWDTQFQIFGNTHYGSMLKDSSIEFKRLAIGLSLWEGMCFALSQILH